MSELKFLNSQDANMRIDHGVGLYEGTPVRIIMESSLIYLYNLLTASDLPWKTVDMNDEKLVTRSLPIGYLDVKWQRRVRNAENTRWVYEFLPTIAFSARASHRRQKSTLHPNNVRITLPVELGSYLDGAHNHMYAPGFGNMLINNYSTNRDFTELKEYEGQSLSRNFAILQLPAEQIILFNELKIGSREGKIGSFKLNNDYKNCLFLSRLTNLGVDVL